MANHYDFRQAKNYHEGRISPRRLVLVIHDMEVKNGADTAEKVADYFASGAVRASAHFCIDLNSVVQGVKLKDTAWAAPGANNDGVQFELAGYARQSRAEWLLPENEAVLNLASAVVAEVIVTFRRLGAYFPTRWLTKAQLLDGRSNGLVGHIDVNAAFHESTHTDPGVNFPWDVFIPKVDWWIGMINADPNWSPKFQ